MAFTLSCPDFEDGGAIPARFTCDGGGDGRSPALSWAGPPAGTRSLVLILHDPDSTRKHDFVHWVLFDIPPLPAGLVEGQGDAICLPGLNDFGAPHYGAPCPRAGEHRYVFDLYALDRDTLALEMGATHAEVEAAMEGHLLGRASLMGRYERV